MEKIKQQLIAIGNRVLETDGFDENSSIETQPEWTSLKHVSMLGEIAEEFGIDIELEEAYRLDSFTRILDYLSAKLGGVPAGDDESGIGALFLARVEAFGERPFLIFPRQEASYTYGEFFCIAGAAARCLQAAGLRQGDRLCLVFPNGPEFLAYYFAAHLLGIILVPINPSLSGREMAFIISDSGARLTLFDRHLAQIRECVGDTTCRLELADADSGFAYESLLENRPQGEVEYANTRLDDTAVILYTSGTTGNPKGVVLSHRNFLADAKALVEWLGFDGGTRTLCILPMFHNNGQVITLLSPMWVGGSTVIVDGRSALMSFWKLIDTYQVEWTSVMPAFLATFLEHGLKRHDRSLKGIVCGGQVLLDEMRSRFESEYGIPVFEGYGLTETTSFSTLNRSPAEHRVFGSIGASLPCNELRVVDEQGDELADGSVGEILIRGDNVASRYHNLPQVTRDRFRDGWLYTGDYGYRDAAGNFFFMTRHDDLIIKGGENIYPAEIENVLAAWEEIAECAAFGVPSPILGEEICVYLKCRDGSAVDEADVKRYCAERLPAFKQPTHIVIINRFREMPELPKGPTRKILRRKLQEHFEETRNRACEGAGVRKSRAYNADQPQGAAS